MTFSERRFEILAIHEIARVHVIIERGALVLLPKCRKLIERKIVPPSEASKTITLSCGDWTMTNAAICVPGEAPIESFAGLLHDC